MTDLKFKIGDAVYSLVHNKIMRLEIEAIEVEISIEEGMPIKHRVKYYYKCKKENSFIHSYERRPYIFNTDAYATVDELLDNLKQQSIEEATDKEIW